MSAEGVFAGAFPGQPIAAVDQVDNLKSQHPRLAHIRDTLGQEDRASGRPWAQFAIQAWDTLESLCASGLHDSLPPVLCLPWVSLAIQCAAHHEATRPYSDPEFLRVAAGPVVGFLTDKLRAMCRKYIEQKKPQLLLFVCHDWTITQIRSSLQKPPTAWPRHMDPRVRIELLRGGGDAPDFFCRIWVHESPVAIPGCAPSVGNGPAVHKLHDVLRWMNELRSETELDNSGSV